jgi:integrase
MAAKMVKTKTPCIFKRGNRYVAIYYDANGKQRRESTRTLEEARKLKRAREAEADQGQLQPASRLTFREYAEDWIERYHGRGSGFRESTRTDYRRHLKLHAFPYFGDRKRLSHITAHDVAKFVGWLCDPEQRKRKLSDKTVRNIVGTLRSCLQSAVREGLIRHNPARDAALPARPVLDEEDGEDVRAFNRKQLAALLKMIHPDHRLMFRFLAATGLRWSELIALQWRHLRLGGSDPHVRVRRALVRGRVEPPKSRYGKRQVPLEPELVSALRKHRSEALTSAEALVPERVAHS